MCERQIISGTALQTDLNLTAIGTGFIEYLDGHLYMKKEIV